MEKGAFLPLRFYPATEWQDYNKLMKYQGDVALFKEHNAFVPAFQLTLPDIGMHWGEGDMTTIEVVNFDTLVTTDISASNYEYYSRAGYYRALVHNRLNHTDANLLSAFDEGKYYIHISDGQTHWYSEVFLFCDLGIDAFGDDFGNETNFDSFAIDQIAGDSCSAGFFCKTTAAGVSDAYAPVSAYLEEEFDLFVVASNYAGPPCGGPADWADSVFLEFRDAAGRTVSETLEIDAVGSYQTTLTVAAGGDIRFYMYIAGGTATKGFLVIHLVRRYASGHISLRWSHNKNFCKLFYEDDYENVMFIDAQEVPAENSIEETVIEDDETNKYPIIATNKKMNTVSMVSGEAMLNAMSLLRLHKDITIYTELGEIVEVEEITMEQSIVDYQATKISLVYREASCSVEACGFDVCCPTEEIPIMEWVEYGGVVALPSAADWSGKYVVVMTSPDIFKIYYSTGAAWTGTITTWDVAGNCLEARINDSGNRFLWVEMTFSNWYLFIELASVADNADGTADVVSDTEYKGGLMLQAEYEDANGDWIPCATPELTVEGAGAITQVCSCGAGTFDFRFHIWDDSCDYGYSNIVSQTIT